MKKSGTATKYPGVFKLGTKKYRVRAKYADPRTGKQKEVDRILDDVTLRQAQRRRSELLEEARTRELDEKRVRVGEFAIVDRVKGAQDWRCAKGRSIA